MTFRIRRPARFNKYYPWETDCIIIIIIHLIIFLLSKVLENKDRHIIDTMDRKVGEFKRSVTILVHLLSFV